MITMIDLLFHSKISEVDNIHFLSNLNIMRLNLCVNIKIHSMSNLRLSKNGIKSSLKNVKYSIKGQKS